MEPFLVSSTVTGIVAQRLVRKVCPHCVTQSLPALPDLRVMGLSEKDVERFNFMKGFGCTRCNGTGYRGRTAIHELLLPDDEFRDAILDRAPSRVLRELARKSPASLTLQEDGLIKAINGVTSLEEVIAQVPRDPATRDPSSLKEMHEKPMF